MCLESGSIIQVTSSRDSMYYKYMGNLGHIWGWADRIWITFGVGVKGEREGPTSEFEKGNGGKGEKVGALLPALSESQKKGLYT